MANKKIFKSVGTQTPVADTFNAAGGKAYVMSAKQALAQIAATNCFNSTFYVSAEENLRIAREAAMSLRSDPLFIAKAAVYSRDRGYMKDMPAFLAVILAGCDSKLFRKVFSRVIDSGKMLDNFFNIARSGVTGRKLNMTASAIRGAINDWFANRTGEQIFRASVATGMRDILRTARPKPDSE